MVAKIGHCLIIGGKIQYGDIRVKTCILPTIQYLAT